MYNRQLDIYNKLKHSQDSIMLEYMPALRAMVYRIRERLPSNEYLANVLGEDVKRIKDAKIAYNIYSLVPIDEQYNTISSNNIIENIQKDELMELVKKILETLSKREQTIIQLYYFEGLSLNKISDILNITSSRISQIHKKVIKKIQNRLGSING